MRSHPLQRYCVMHGPEVPIQVMPGIQHQTLDIPRNIPELGLQDPHGLPQELCSLFSCLRVTLCRDTAVQHAPAAVRVASERALFSWDVQLVPQLAAEVEAVLRAEEGPVTVPSS
jgi:hypothetical protein